MTVGTISSYLTIDKKKKEKAPDGRGGEIRNGKKHADGILRK